MDFDALTLEQLRQRQSAKWRGYDDDVLPAWVAESDVPLAEPITRALHAAVDRGDTGYADLGPLQTATTSWLARRLGWQIDPEAVTSFSDVHAAILAFFRTLTRPGDRIVVNPPVYPPFYDDVNDSDRTVVEVPLLSTPDGWRLDLAGLERAFRDGARLYLLSSPHNPTGTVWSVDELREVAVLADRYGVFVISDEVHGPLTLPGANHSVYPTVSAAAARHSVVLTSASKTYNIAGLKCAVAVAGSAKTRTAFDRLPAITAWSTSHFGVLATIAAFTECDDWLDELLVHLDRNRRLLDDELAARLPQIGYRPPDAGYLAWLDCRPLGLDNPAETFLAKGRLAVSDGVPFGPGGSGWVRLNIGTTKALLTEAVRRIHRSLDAG